MRFAGRLGRVKFPLICASSSACPGSVAPSRRAQLRWPRSACEADHTIPAPSAPRKIGTLAIGRPVARQRGHVWSAVRCCCRCSPQRTPALRGLVVFAQQLAGSRPTLWRTPRPRSPGLPRECRALAGVRSPRADRYLTQRSCCAHSAMLLFDSRYLVASARVESGAVSYSSFAAASASSSRRLG